MQTLRLFLDVARCHSFSQAAALHGITQSAASQRVGQLEKRLGVTLLDRSVRPLALTEAGQAFLEGCRELLERYERLAQRVSRMRGDPSGPVRVAAIYSSGIDLLDRLCERFEADHPRIAVEIRYDQPEGVYQAVHGFECDLGILSYPQRWRGVGLIPLRDEIMVVVCRPEHPLAKLDKVRAADLTPHEMVTFNRELPVGRRIRQYLRDNGAAPRITHSFDNIDTIKTAVAVSDRFSVLPRRTVLRDVAAGTLAIVTLEPELLRPIGVIFRRRYKHEPPFSPAAQVFVDYLLRFGGRNAESSSLEPQLEGARS
ncbi:MAG TPA: LysR family transcriptional regulator [Phycisphaeraceae bacterium]